MEPFSQPQVTALKATTKELDTRPDSELNISDELDISGELNISDYRYSVPASCETAEAVKRWSTKLRENTRTKITLRLVNLLGVTLIATLGFLGFAAFKPGVDKEVLKEIIPQVITPQVTLLGVALTFYFMSKEEE